MRTKSKGTLCWECQKATGMCSWSKSLIPVKGWTADDGKMNIDGRPVESYFVHACPEFERDKPKKSPMPDVWPGERWAEIPGYDGRYVVSDQGRVYSVDSGAMLRKQLTKSGRKVVNLSKRGTAICRSTRRLVANAFVDNAGGSTSLISIDGDQQNDRADNLKWVGPQAKRQNTSAIRASKDGIVHRFRSLAEAVRWIHGGRNFIPECLRGERETYKGYKWEYDHGQFES